MSEPRMTRAEWQRAERVEQCADHRHAPTLDASTLDHPLWLCACGAVRWKPEPIKETT